MRKTSARENCSKHFGKVAGALLLFACLAILVGCQGVSAGGNQQLPSGLSLANSSMNFGGVVAGTSKTVSVNATNSGTASLTVSSAAISSKYFTLVTPTLPITVAAGQTTPISVKFSPNAPGAFTAAVTITTNDPTNPTAQLSLAGTGTSSGGATGTLAINPTSEAFGDVTVGTQVSQTVTLTNSGTASDDISQVSVSGTGFQVSGITTPLTLNAGQSTTFTVKFSPQSAGGTSGTVTITSDGSNPSLAMPLSGTGDAAGTLGSNPTSLNFGSVTVGTKQTLSETVTNTGGSSLTISQVGISGTGFTMSGITAPVTLTQGQSASFNVSFTPSATGSASGNVTITSNASNPSLSIPLSGTGISAGDLTPNPASLSFGNVTIGNNVVLTEKVTNNGGSSVTISQVGISGTGFTFSGITTPVTLTSGQSASFSVTFTPTSAGSASGNVTITSNGTNPTLNVPLSGTGVTPGTLGSNPTSLSFGSVTVGNNSSLTEKVTNTGGTSVTISQVGISGAAFSFSGITAPVTLTSGQSASFSVTFKPTATGSTSGTLTITSNASNPSLTVALSGTGTAVAAGQLTVTPTTLPLGNVVVGNSGTASGSLTASGASVTVTAANSNNSVFSVGGLSLPVTIPAGQSVPFTVTFSPTTAGAVTASLTFTSNASPTTTTETLTGTGTAAATHTVSLSWTASTSSSISGYNVYRAVYTNSCGGFAKINSVLNTGVLYTDSTVANSTNYCYATTAVNSSNEESGYSNIVSNVQIP